jgi:sec-independent protein translocase protein TatC
MSDEPEQKSGDLAEGTLMSHLTELRSRLFKVFGSVFGVFLVLIPFSRTIFDFVAAPLTRFVPSGEMIAIGAVTSLTATISLTFYLALFLAMPIILYQVWAFVAPGLYKKEKNFAMPLLASSVTLFFAGLAFAYYVVFPLIFGFVAAFTPDVVEWKPDMAEYVSFVMLIALVFGVAFETPIATVLTVATGLTTPEFHRRFSRFRFTSYTNSA